MMRALSVGVVAVLALGCKGKSQSGDASGAAVATSPTGKKSSKQVGGLGTKVAAGLLSDLRASPDGKTLTWLKEAEKPRLEGVPPLLRVGELWSSTAGGEPRKLGNGVSNFPGGYLFTPDSSWVLLLTGYNAAQQIGELDAVSVVDAKTERQRLGSSVSYMLASPDAKWVAFVDAGVLKVGLLPQGPFRDVAGEVANAEFSRDSRTLFFRRKTSSGGGLFAVAVADPKDNPGRLSELVGDYKLTPDGAWVVFTAKKSPSDNAYTLFSAETKSLKPRQIAKEVFAFSFSPDGKWLARIEGLSPEAGGRLFIGPFDGSSEGRKLGEAVRDLEFAKSGASVAWRDHYTTGERREGEGELFIAALPSGEPKLLAKRCRSYEWAPDSQALAFTLQTLKRESAGPMGTFTANSVDLRLYLVGAAEPLAIKNWVYDYDFTPDSKRLLFRSDCVREGRACDLQSLDVTEPTKPPKKLIEGVYGFKLSADGTRALYTYARTQGDLYDTGVLNLASGEYLTVEQMIRMPPMFLDPSGSKVAYVVGDTGRPGVYLAEKGYP